MHNAPRCGLKSSVSDMTFSLLLYMSWSPTGKNGGDCVSLSGLFRSISGYGPLLGFQKYSSGLLGNP